MDLNSPEFAHFLNEMIKNRVQKEVKEELSKFGIVRGWSAKVSSVNGDGTVNVTLATDSVNIIPNLKNKSGVALIANDEVELRSMSSLNSAYVGIKK